MDELLFLATEDGVAVAQRDGAAWRIVNRGLAGTAATSVIAREGVALAGTRAGVWRSDDLGRTWYEASAGLTVRYVRWLANHPEISDREYAGTEPALVFVSHDGARTWRPCDEVAQLRDAHGWSLPYSPEAGCVRGFAFNGRRAYAAVEVGGALRSDDGGESWRLAGGGRGDPSFSAPPAPQLDADVHAIAVHPSSPDLVYAATGNGFYRSYDGGETWARVYACYCRAAWIDPADPEHIILGPADGVDRQGRIEATRDGGRTWEPASQGLATPWRNYMVERFTPVADELLAVLSNGAVWTASLADLAWRPVLPEAGSVNAVAGLPV